MVSRGGLAWLESTRLRRIPWLLHAFSTRRGGVSQAPCAGLNLGFTGSDQRQRVKQNRRLFFSQLGAADFAPASVRQVHSSLVYAIARRASGTLEYKLPGSATAAPGPPMGDGLMTAEPGILLTIRIADCLPVLLVDSRRRVVAAIHAGWRGALARVIEKGVGEMRRVYGSDPKDLLAALGPSIRACCFEVGGEVVEAFHGSFVHAEKFFRALRHRPEAAMDRHSILFISACPPGHAPEHVPVARLDLIAVAHEQLASAGVRPANILAADYCTACCTDQFFSHRREGGLTGRQVAAMAIRPLTNKRVRSRFSRRTK